MNDEIERLRRCIEEMRRAVDYVGGDECIRRAAAKAGLTYKDDSVMGPSYVWAPVGGDEFYIEHGTVRCSACNRKVCDVDLHMSEHRSECEGDK